MSYQTDQLRKWVPVVAREAVGQRAGWKRWRDDEVQISSYKTVGIQSVAGGM